MLTTVFPKDVYSTPEWSKRKFTLKPVLSGG